MQIRTKLTHTACSPTLTFSAFSENNFQNNYIFVLYYISLVTFNYVPFEFFFYFHCLSREHKHHTWICAGFLSFDYICIAIEVPIIKGKSWNPTMWLNPATFLPLSQARTWISSITCSGLLYDQRVEVKVDFSFCW